MRPKWPKLASQAKKYAQSGFSSLLHSLLPKDTLLRTYLHTTMKQRKELSTHKQSELKKTTS